MMFSPDLPIHMSQEIPLQKRTAYVAMGSNLASSEGDPRETLAAAVKRMGGFGRVSAISSLYETDPVGYSEQPAFLNAVIVLETALDPEELLRRMLDLEKRFGRSREAGPANGPRTLDLDLLLMDDLVFDSETLRLPHPGFARRRFVLVPLHEIAPELRPPPGDCTVAELLAGLPDEGANRVAAVRQKEQAGWASHARADKGKTR